MFAALLFCAVASAQSTLTDDAFTSGLTAKSTYGDSSALFVAPEENSYLRFSFSGLPAGITSANISGADLVLYVDSVNKPGTFDVYVVNAPWSEGSINFNNAPSLGALLLSAVPVNATGFLTLNLTSAVKAWLNNPSTNYGIALVPSSGSLISVSFDSKENSFTSHAAQLNLVLVSAGPQGPQGVEGATGPAGPIGPAGPMGAIGPIGPMGPMGATGPAGPTGPAGANGKSFNFRNLFDNTAAYAVNDVVTYNGSSYVAIAASAGPNNSTPDTNPSAWSLMAQQGATGSAGATGAAGPQGTSGPMGPAGPQGLVGLTGAAGPIGPQGPAGPQGSPGAGAASSVFSAFVPGPVTQAYMASSFIPDSPITVTRISATAKTVPDAGCGGGVLRVGGGSANQDLALAGGLSTDDTGALTLPIPAGTPLQVQVLTPASCPKTTPADVNVAVQYRGQQSGDTPTCPTTGLACGGVCTNTQTDSNNCGACGNACGKGIACTSGKCCGTHLNGLGQSYVDCTIQIIGQPGNPNSYDLLMAMEAAAAFAPNPTQILCNGFGAVTSTNGLTTAVWVFQGPTAGYVHANSVAPFPPPATPPPPVCPTTNDPAWN